MEQLLLGEQSLEAFLPAFQRGRALAHLRRTQAEKLQELLRLQVQDGLRRRGRLRGHLHLAEQHCARGALLAVVHLLLQCLRRCREGLQDLEAEIRQGHVNSCCPHLTGPSESGAHTRHAMG